MKINFTEVNGVTIAQIISPELQIADTQQALQLLVDCLYQGATALILEEKHFTPAFFDLKTGLAGDILQKFSTYGAKLAIVGDFSRYTDSSLRTFMHESNRAGRINFVATLDQALDVFL